MAIKRYFIINPVAGGIDKSHLPGLIKEIFSPQEILEIKYTQQASDVKLFCKDACQLMTDVVVVVGGDGTIHDACEALLDTKIKVAIVPLGSGNGIANALNISLNIKAALKTVKENNSKSVKGLRLNDKFFLATFGIGFDAFIAHQFQSAKSRGLKGYAKLVLKNYTKFKPFEINAQIDKQKVEFDHLLFCTIANIKEFGNGFYISNKSYIYDDGYTFVTVKKPKFLLGFLWLLILSKFNLIHWSKLCKAIEVCKKVEIDADIECFQLDGEPFVGSDKKYLIRNEEKSLEIIC